MAAIRLYRQGYPDYMPLGEFVRRFNVLVPPDALPMSLLVGLNGTASEKQAAEILLLHIDLERTSYRLGLSQVSISTPSSSQDCCGISTFTHLNTHRSLVRHHIPTQTPEMIYLFISLHNFLLYVYVF